MHTLYLWSDDGILVLGFSNSPEPGIALTISSFDIWYWTQIVIYIMCPKNSQDARSWSFCNYDSLSDLGHSIPWRELLAIYAHIGLESTFGDFDGHFDTVSEVR